MKKYITTNWTWQVKDWWQQPLHFLGGALIVMPGCLAAPEWWPPLTLASIAYGFYREYKQHAPVCIDMDSSFWTAGALSGLVVLVSIVI